MFLGAAKTLHFWVPSEIENASWGGCWWNKLLLGRQNTAYFVAHVNNQCAKGCREMKTATIIALISDEAQLNAFCVVFSR
jgi:hypothetical protein